MMNKLLSTVSATALALMLSASLGFAAPIFIAGINPVALTLTPSAGNTVHVTSDGFQGVGTYAPDADSGNALFGPMDFIAGPPAGLDLPIVPPTAESFQYSSFGNTNNLLMTIGWTNLNNSFELVLTGSATVLASNGTPSFTSDFPVGSTATAEAFFPTSVCEALNFDNPSAVCDITGTPQLAFFEGGDFVPGGGPPITLPPPAGPPTDISEPGTLGLIGAALIVFSLFGRRAKLFRQGRCSTAI